MYIEKLMERHQREWKKCLNSDSNRDPPAYAADCSAVERLRPQSDSRARGHLNHLASASGPPHSRDLRFFPLLRRDHHGLTPKLGQPKKI